MPGLKPKFAVEPRPHRVPLWVWMVGAIVALSLILSVFYMVKHYVMPLWKAWLRGQFSENGPRVTPIVPPPETEKRPLPDTGPSPPQKQNNP